MLFILSPSGLFGAGDGPAKPKPAGTALFGKPQKPAASGIFGGSQSASNTGESIFYDRLILSPLPLDLLF